MVKIQAPCSQEQILHNTVVGHKSTKALSSYWVAKYTLIVIALLQEEEDWHLISPPPRKGKSEPEEAYSADTTQQPIHIKASPNQAEHAIVCHWGIVLFLCNTQMIKEFNTASRLMTPLGCRGTQERRRQGLWRILAETGIGSKIYKFIHQKAAFFLCRRCVRVTRVQVAESEREWVRWWGRDGDETGREISSLIEAAFSELKNIMQLVTTLIKKKEKTATLPQYWLHFLFLHFPPLILQWMC